MTKERTESDPVKDLSEEDLVFIGELFKDFSDYEKHPLEKEDKCYD